MLPVSKLVSQLARWIYESNKTVALTGAGISTESGIPDFRSANGIWSKYDPEDFSYSAFISGPEARIRFWKAAIEIHQPLVTATPNLGHNALSCLEKWGKLDCVITQNIDDLHRQAGNAPDRIIELHGNDFKVHCIKCGQDWDRTEMMPYVIASGFNPICPKCNQGFLKPAIVLFEEPLPENAITGAVMKATIATLFIVIGSSLKIMPAASLPYLAKRSRARVVIINHHDTDLDAAADLRIRGGAGEILDLLATEVAQLLRNPSHSETGK